MLATGGHVKIGTYEYQLDESVDQHYIHQFSNLFSPKADVSGSPGKQQLRPEKLLWSMDDWSGGEGNRVFNDDQPFVYDYSFGLNGRIRGQLTGRPARTLDASSLTTPDITARPMFGYGDDKLWVGGGYRISYSGDASSWTQVNDTGTDGTDFGQLESKSTSYKITSMVGDANWIYYAAWHNGSSGTRILLRRQADNTTVADDVQSEATSRAPYAGLAIMYGRLYAWTGRKLFEIDLFQQGNDYGASALSANDSRKVLDTGVETATSNVFDNNWWGDVVAAENSVFCFYSTDFISTVYEYRDGAARPVWKAPYGLTIKSMTYNNGIVYFAGHWSADGNEGRGAIYAMPMDTMVPVFVSWVRKQNDMNFGMQRMAPSYGDQILMATKFTGRLFIYDAAEDGLTMWDDIAVDGTPTNPGDEGNPPRVVATDALNYTQTSSGEHIGDLTTFGKKRLVLIYKGDLTNYSLLSYDDDEPTNRQATVDATYNEVSAPLVSGYYDFGFPHETKALMGFHVAWKAEDTGTTSGLKAGQEIKVEYQREENGTWTSAGTITSSTTPSGGTQGRTFIQVSDGTTTRKFYNMRVRITLYGKRTAGVNYQPPIVYSLTTEASLFAYDETWDLIVRVKDESGGTRPDDRQWNGEILRDYLEDLAQNKNVVTFLDGYRYKDPGTYTTHTVTVEDPTDIIHRNAEGIMRIRLRAVPV